jgi:hypothetical protein
MAKKSAKNGMPPEAEAVYKQLRETVPRNQLYAAVLDGAAEKNPALIAKFKQALSGMKLPAEVLEAFNAMVDDVLQHHRQYNKLRKDYLAQGFPEDILPKKFDANFFAVLNIALDQLEASPEEPQQFAEGGAVDVAEMAQTVAGYGRDGDTMLAHITPEEARLLKRHGGSGTLNPNTGLTEYRSRLKRFFKKVGSAISDVVKGVVSAVKEVVSTPLGKAVAAIGLSLLVGPAAASFIGATSSAAIAATSAFVGGAGSTLLAGGSISDALKAGVVGGLTAGLTNGLSASIASDTAFNAISGGLSGSTSVALGNTLGNAATGAISGGIGAVLTGQDPIEALIRGGLSSGVSGGINTFANEIPGFSDLSKDYGGVGVAAQRAITSGLSAGVFGRDVGDAMTASILGSVNRTIGNELSGRIKDLSGYLKNSYDTAQISGAAIEDNVRQQNAIVSDYTSTVDAINSQRAAIASNIEKYNAANAAGDIALANQYAELINAEAPKYEAARAAAEAKISGFTTQLDSLKSELPQLEEAFTQQTQALGSAVQEFKQQEAANAALIAERFDDVLGAKETLEKLSGASIDAEQFDALSKNGDIVANTDALTKYLMDDSAVDTAEVKKALEAGDLTTALNTARFEGYIPAYFGAGRGETWETFTEDLRDKAATGDVGRNWAKNADGSYAIKGRDGSILNLDASGNVLDVTDVADTLAARNKVQDEMTPEDWLRLYATPTTDPITGETITGAEPGSYSSEYSPQDFGVDPNLGWEAYAQQMLYMQGRGELPSQWVAGPNGTYIYTGEDGDTLTLGADGEVIGTTEAPVGMMPGELPRLGAPIKSAPPARPAAPVRPAAPARPTMPMTTATMPVKGGTSDNANLIALLAALGGSSEQPTAAPVQENSADVQLMEDIFGPTLSLNAPENTRVKAASGGSVSELLQILRG